VIWRGGRRLKTPNSDTEARNTKQNGSSQDSVMIIDSDDDESAPAGTSSFVDKPEFEDHDHAGGASKLGITQTLELSLGCEVLHIAVPPLVASTSDDIGPELLQTKMVFAVSCATTDVYVVTVPLTPPSHQSKARQELRANVLTDRAGKSLWGETLFALAGQERRSDGLAITLSKPGVKGRSHASSTNVVVAAHSRDASGTLRLWELCVDSGKAGKPTEPFQTEYLQSPLNGVSFNPIHITQLLTISSSQALRIYDYSMASVPADDTPQSSFPAQGSWLLSLFPPFARGSLSQTARKPITAAAWVGRGRAILALLADGQWGVWDIDGGGPTTSTTGANLFGKTGLGVRGAALSAFSITGQLEGTSPLRNPTNRKSDGEFVPMTPHTRREVFVGGPERLNSVKGSIEVVRLPTYPGGVGEETAVLWLGAADHVVTVIPAISRFWDAQLRRSSGGGVNLFSGAQPSRMIRLNDLSAGLMGERCCGVTASARFPRNPGDGEEEGLPVEIAVQGESRLVFVQENEDATPAPTRIFGPRKRKLGLAPGSEPPSAIIVHPRQDKAAAASFNLSVSKRGGLMDVRPSQDSGVIPIGSSFDSTTQFTQSQDTLGDEMTLTQSMLLPPAREGADGLGFVNSLENAADAIDDEEAAEDRNVEAEMLDIMEIDRALEDMQSDRDAGTKHVFFETA
jgi:hypothetical protein